MEDIEVLDISNTTESKYIRPKRVTFKQVRIFVFFFVLFDHKIVILNLNLKSSFFIKKSLLTITSLIIRYVVFLY